MEPSDHKHEKIRFRRTDIVRLHTLPSATMQERRVRDPHLRARLAPLLRWTFVALVVLLLGLPAAIYALSISGLGDARLRAAAEDALTALAGVDIDARIGSPRLSIDRSRFIGIEVKDVRLTGGVDGADIVEAGRIRFGVRFRPLLGGEVQLGSATIEDATISLAALPESSGQLWTANITGPDGLVDPGLVMKAVFQSIHRAFETFDMGSTKSIDLKNVEILLPPHLRASSLMVSEAHVERIGAGTVAFNATANIDGRPVQLDGSAELENVTRRIAAFKSVVSLAPTYFEGPFAANAPRRNFAVTRWGGGMELTVEGNETSGAAGQFRLRAEMTGAEVHFANGQKMTGTTSFAASFDPKSRKVEIEKLLVSVGRSRFDFHGAVGPSPIADGEAPTYRFELVSDGSKLAPGGSSEPDLIILARLAGHYDPAANMLTADEIAVRTGRGDVLGKSVVTFAGGLSPGIDLVLATQELPVSHAKQLWPWFSASGAQRWAHANLFGGIIRNTSIAMSIKPGRLGDGVALRQNEISGHFEMAGARFDITGQIPPVRDAIGVVDFRGADVDISLESGTIYLPTGRTVAASDGKFLIREGDKPPVIGDLDISIDGKADAVAELASYKPIDAMRHLELTPDELAGDVSGQVKARIPLQQDVEMARLGWNVKLDYTDLALVNAKARLNGMPALIELAEPLGASDKPRVRNISIELDDKAREELAPGLSALLSGPISIKLEGSGQKTQQISADLTAARLDLPWVGWTKGPGVPATMSFSLDTSKGDNRMTDIKLSGKTFAISGDATVNKSGLMSARFDTVQLNRGDDIAVDIKRAGGGYRIAIKGNAFDARGLIKRVLSDPEAAAGGGGTTKGAPISITAKIANVGGFDRENLALVEIDYEGVGASVGNLRLTGATLQGGTVSVTDTPAGAGRTVRMRSSDAGGLMRFLDIYPHMQGGQIALELTSTGGGPLKGQIEARDFALVDEPRLKSIVATAPPGDRSLNDTIKRDIDTSRVTFDRGFALVEKGDGYLSIDRGVLRGPLIGTTFQGSLYDKSGNMAITGTFMPAYGLNRLFAEIPIVGQLLGNGRDRGLIGITYKVAGDAKSPQVQVNPISAIAPGIFRSIFEFN
ncbi:MAG: DUF3971 domain-containing protein [Mesorhizobium sp.]|nr:DUF3971 domain-containing protein [Mesorhizobium sp.]